jgi:hypothetical protein
MLRGRLRLQSTKILEKRFTRYKNRPTTVHDWQAPFVDPALYSLDAHAEGSRNLARSEMFGCRGGSLTLPGGYGQHRFEGPRTLLLPPRAQVAHDLFGEPNVICGKHRPSSLVVVSS